MKPPLLLLCHRFPYPPDKGDKIRSWQLLQHLASRHRVFLGTFIDDPNDWQHREIVEALCADTCILPLNPLWARLRSARGLLSGDPVSVPYYLDRRLWRWVRDVCRDQQVDRFVAYSSPMAEYLEACEPAPVHAVLDFVDMDSDKWRQYAQQRGGLARWFFEREARHLFNFEKRITERGHASLFVSAAEAEAFRSTRTRMPVTRLCFPGRWITGPMWTR
jgi:hypothetical protein